MGIFIETKTSESEPIVFDVPNGRFWVIHGINLTVNESNLCGVSYEVSTGNENWVSVFFKEYSSDPQTTGSTIVLSRGMTNPYSGCGELPMMSIPSGARVYIDGALAATLVIED